MSFERICSAAFSGYTMNGFYGIIEKAKFENPYDYKQFKIYPQYDIFLF
jgi:hypothetical protein